MESDGASTQEPQVCGYRRVSSIRDLARDNLYLCQGRARRLVHRGAKIMEQPIQFIQQGDAQEPLRPYLQQELTMPEPEPSAFIGFRPQPLERVIIAFVLNFGANHLGARKA